MAVVAALAVALGLMTSATILLQKADVWEVPIACGYALTMLALLAVWQACHDAAHRGRWMLAASLAMGLAIGSRPSLLFGAIIVFIPVGLAPGDRHRLRQFLLCAVAPLLLCGLGLMAYNRARFGSPLDFGERYQLGLYRQDSAVHFSAGYLGFNFWVYFLQPAAWTVHFPFVGAPSSLWPTPEGHAAIEDPFGVLTNIPLLLGAFAVPLAWRGRTGESRAILRQFAFAAALLFASSAVILCLFYGNCSRYEMDFLPSLALLAVLGVLGLEHALADRPPWLRIARAVWGLALVFSAGFIFALSLEHYADQRYRLGNVLMTAGRRPEAIGQYERALRARPDFAEALGNLGAALLQAGQVSEAIASDERALRLEPGSALTHYNLAGALLVAGRRQEAAAEYDRAFRLRPELGPGPLAARP